MVMGGTGMLGHQLLRDLTDSGHEVVGTVRGDISPRLEKFGISAQVMTGIDALAPETVRRALFILQPDVVINCIGFVKQLESPSSAQLEFELNARFPHVLARLCTDSGCRLIHISTDCVFLGDRGMYQESDPVDARDLYGKTKAAGEVTDVEGCLTIRTSIIGHELWTRNGLLEWFLNETGEVQGRAQAIFSGFPTTVLAQVIDRHVLPAVDLNGLYHVSADPISKFELLGLINRHYHRSTLVQREETYSIDRSLDSTRFRLRTGFQPESWPNMIAKMARSCPSQL